MDRFRYNHVAPEKLSEFHRKMQERTDSILAGRIDPGLFTSVYFRQEIGRDRNYVEEQRAFSRREPTKGEVLAKAFEVFVFESARDGKWFGENTMVILPAEYDDRKNGVDIAVAKFVPTGLENIPLVLAVDITINPRSGSKFRHTLKAIRRGSLGEMKYFSTNYQDQRSFKGRVSEVPHVIVGIEGKSAELLIERWISEGKLGGDALKLIFLQEIYEELLAFIAFTRVHAPEVAKRRLLDIFQRQLEGIEALLRGRNLQEEAGELLEDKVYLTIADICSLIRQKPEQFLRSS